MFRWIKITKDNFQNLKMRNKLMLAFIIITIIPQLYLSIFVYNMSERSIKSEVINYSKEALEQVNVNIDFKISEIKNIAISLSSDNKVQEILKQDKSDDIQKFYYNNQYMTKVMDSYFNTNFWTSDIYVFSYNGEVYGSSKNTASLSYEYDFTRTKWFSTMKLNNLKDMLITTYEQNDLIVEGNPQKVISIVEKIYDNDTGKEIGYIFININFSMFIKTLGSVNESNNQNIFLVDNNKTIVYHKNELLLSSQYRSDYISELLMKKNGYLTSNSNGKNKIVIFNTSETTNWTIISEIPVEYIFENISKLQIIVMISTLLGLYIALIFVLILSRSISEPVFVLQKKMKQVEQGDFNIKLDIQSNDEIGQLSKSFGHMVKKTNELIQKVYKSEIFQKEAELNALQAQINPHFLYNTLQVIDLLAEEEGIDSISDACQALSKIFRYSINKGQEFVKLREEINHIENYILIQKLRFGEKINVTYELEEDCLDNLIVKLIVQPIVENAVIHGVENSLGKCDITVSVYKEEDKLYIKVWNNGAGIDSNTLEYLNNMLNNTTKDEIIHGITYNEGHNSIGLRNTNARIKLYFGEDYGILMESGNDIGTTVQIKLPVR